MQIVNIHEAKTHLSRLLEEVVAGNPVVIAKAGKPIAKIVPLASLSSNRSLGLLKGKVKISDDFDAALPRDVLDAFER